MKVHCGYCMRSYFGNGFSDTSLKTMFFFSVSTVLYPARLTLPLGFHVRHWWDDIRIMSPLKKDVVDLKHLEEAPDHCNIWPCLS